VQPAAPGGAAECTPGWGKNKDLKKEESTRAREARGLLPLFGPSKEKPLQRQTTAAHDLRLKKLRNRVRGMARTLLHAPVVANALMNASDIDHALASFVNATTSACARKRIPADDDVVHGICVAELFAFRNGLRRVEPRRQR
jgi:hypothetical protein